MTVTACVCTHLACEHSGLSPPRTPCAFTTGDPTVTPPSPRSTNTGSIPVLLTPPVDWSATPVVGLTGGQVTAPMVTVWVERVFTVRVEWVAWVEWVEWVEWEVTEAPSVALWWERLLRALRWEWVVWWECMLLVALLGAAAVAAVAVAVASVEVVVVAVASVGWPSLSIVEPRANRALLPLPLLFSPSPSPLPLPSSLFPWP